MRGDEGGEWKNWQVSTCNSFFFNKRGRENTNGISLSLLSDKGADKTQQASVGVRLEPLSYTSIHIK